MIVVDTSIIAHLWIPSQYSDLTKQLLTIDRDWISPYLWKSEFRNVVFKYLRKDLIEKNKALEITSFAEEFMLHREYEVPSKEIVSLGINSKLSAYDCEFVCLAKLKDVNLITLDREISKEFPKIAHYLPDYLKLHYLIHYSAPEIG